MKSYKNLNKSEQDICRKFTNSYKKCQDFVKIFTRFSSDLIRFLSGISIYKVSIAVSGLVYGNMN